MLRRLSEGHLHVGVALVPHAEGAVSHLALIQGNQVEEVR